MTLRAKLGRGPEFDTYDILAQRVAEASQPHFSDGVWEEVVVVMVRVGDYAALAPHTARAEPSEQRSLALSSCSHPSSRRQQLGRLRRNLWRLGSLARCLFAIFPDAPACPRLCGLQQLGVQIPLHPGKVCNKGRWMVIVPSMRSQETFEKVPYFPIFDIISCGLQL